MDLSQYTDEQLQQIAGPQSAPPAAPAAASAPAPEVGTGPDTKGIVEHTIKAVGAALSSGINSATFGGAEAVLGKVAPGAEAAVAGNEAAHPYASMAGGVAGALAGGGGIGMGMRALEHAPSVIGQAARIFGRALAPQEGHAVANVVKSAGVNATVGGVTAAASGQDLPTAAQTAVVSGVAGPVAEKTASVVAPKLLPASKQAWALLAKKFNMSASDFEAARNSHFALTGDQPSMAQIAGYHEAGQLNQLARANPIIADAAIKAKNAGSASLAEQIAATNRANRPQTMAGLDAAREAQMTQDMNPIRNNIMGLKKSEIELLQHPVIQKSVDANLHNGFPQGPNGAYDPFKDTVGQLGRIADGTDRRMSVGMLDTIRQGLDTAASMEGADKHAIGELRRGVTAIAKRDPGYQLAKDKYDAAYSYSDGFKIGRDGNPAPPDALSMKDRNLAAGYQHGLALHDAEAALGTASRGLGGAPPESPNPAHLATAAANAIHGSGWTLPHLLRSFPNVKLPAGVQKVIGDQLFDPRRVQQGIANLQRGGATLDDIKRMGTFMGGAVSENIARALSNSESQ